MAVCTAQALVSCQFCDTCNDVKWKCYDCSLILCEQCKVKLHSKLTFEKVHTTIELRNAVQTTQTGENVANLYKVPCDKHPKQTCCLFCKSCDEIICPSCLLDLHTTHTLEEIPMALERKKAFLEKISTINKEQLSSIQSKRKNIDDLFSKEQSQYEQVKENIERHIHEMAKRVKEVGNKLLDQLDNFSQRSLDCIESERKRLDECEEKLFDKRSKIETTLLSLNPADLFSEAKNIEVESEEFKTSVQIRSKVEFIGNKLAALNVQQYFGSLIEIRVLKSYITDLPDVGLIKACGEYLWVANKERKSLRKCLPVSGLQTITCIDNIEVSDFAVMKSEELLLKLSRSNKLKVLSKTSRQKMFRDFSPLKPTCIHITRTGDVVIGVKDVGANFTLSDDSKRQLIVLTPSAKQKYTYECDQHKSRLFTYVWHVTSTNVGELCVIDRTADDFTGRLIMLGPEGTTKWIFRGDQNHSTAGGTFKPRDLVAIRNGNIVVAERLTHSLYVLSASDGLLVSLVTTAVDVFLPQSLCTDNYDNLWIGSGTYKGEQNCAKLHQTQLHFLK